MKREFQARFRENVRVKFPCVTRLPTIMKKRQAIAFLTFLLLGLVTSAQTDSIPEKTYLLKGKIINEISMTPGCGYIKYGTVIEFIIIEFSDLTYSEKEIGVIIRCPEFYKDNFFEVGKLYEMNVSYEISDSNSWTIPNKKQLEKYNLKSKLWAINTKKIE